MVLTGAAFYHKVSGNPWVLPINFRLFPQWWEPTKSVTKAKPNETILWKAVRQSLCRERLNSIFTFVLEMLRRDYSDGRAQCDRQGRLSHRHLKAHSLILVQSKLRCRGSSYTLLRSLHHSVSALWALMTLILFKLQYIYMMLSIHLILFICFYSSTSTISIHTRCQETSRTGWMLTWTARILPWTSWWLTLQEKPP